MATDFDKLSAVLFDGTTVALDIKTMPGTAQDKSRDELAAALWASMERAGLIVDGNLMNALEPQS